MFKRFVILLLFAGVIQPVFSQTDKDVDDIRSEMNMLYNELELIDRKITSYSSIEQYETKYNAHKNLMELYFKAYGPQIIDNRDDLYPIYLDYQTLYVKIGNKIYTYRQKEKAVQIKEKLENYEANLKNLLAKAQAFCEDKNSDSLEKTKKASDAVLNRAIMLQSSNQSLFDDNMELEEIINRIGECHNDINALAIRKSRIGDILFKAIILAGIVLMAGNIVSSKISMMKALKPKDKTSKKSKNKEEYSI